MTLSDDLSVRAAAQERRLDLPWPRLDPTARRASPVWIPVAVAAVIGLGFATWSLLTGDLGWRQAVGVFVLLAAAAIAEAFPVPIEGVAVGGTSVATIFLVAVAVVYGWAAAAVAAFFAMAFVEVARRRPISRVAFNCGIYVLGAIAAGVTAAAFDDDSLLQLVLASVAAATAFYLVDITLLSAVLARSTRARFVSSLRSYLYATLAPFAILASLAVILVVIWDRSPYVAVVLVVPVLATAIYQRWLHGALDRLREFDRLEDEFIAIVSLQGTTRFSVSDDGPGIPLEQSERIFEKFYRLDSSTTTSAFGGTGLGLYISRELVEGMDGQIGVTSTLGEGSTFSFELPVYDSP